MDIEDRVHLGVRIYESNQDEFNRTHWHICKPKGRVRSGGHDIEKQAYARHKVLNVIVCLYLYIQRFILDDFSVWNEYFMNELLVNT